MWTHEPAQSFQEIHNIYSIALKVQQHKCMFLAQELPSASPAANCSSFPAGRGSRCCGSIAQQSLSSLSQTPPAGRAALPVRRARDRSLQGRRTEGVGHHTAPALAPEPCRHPLSRHQISNLELVGKWEGSCTGFPRLVLLVAPCFLSQNNPVVSRRCQAE